MNWSTERIFYDPTMTLNLDEIISDGGISGFSPMFAIALAGVSVVSLVISYWKKGKVNLS